MATDIGIALGRKGKRAEPVEISLDRELVPGDIDWLLGQSVGAEPKPIKALRHTHHLAARLLAEGRNETEVAEITGYSISRVSIMLNHDPMFKQLVAYYRENLDSAYVNVHERLAGLGTHALEELQDRLDTKPESFGNKELRELASMALDRSVAPPKGVGQGQGPSQDSGPRVVIQFVEPKGALERPQVLIEAQERGLALGEAKPDA